MLSVGPGHHYFSADPGLYLYGTRRGLNFPNTWRSLLRSFLTFGVDFREFGGGHAHTGHLKLKGTRRSKEFQEDEEVKNEKNLKSQSHLSLRSRIWIIRLGGLAGSPIQAGLKPQTDQCGTPGLIEAKATEPFGPAGFMLSSELHLVSPRWSLLLSFTSALVSSSESNRRSFFGGFSGGAMDAASKKLVSTTPRRCMFSFSRILLLIIIVLVAETRAASRVSRGSGKSSVFSLFNLKSKSKFWSESLIRTDFDDLEGSVPSSHGKMEVVNYTKAGNIANFLKMSEVDSIYLPVPMNFIFIGFEGKGNHEFLLGSEEMSRWFTKIDHIFEHTRIPHIGEILTPFYKTSVEKSQRYHLPLVSHVNYNFSVHAIQMGEKVTSVFEQAIAALSRKEVILDSRADEDVVWQVDIDRMGYILTTLIDHLKLEDAYNVFILNPKYNNKKLHYGYRRGLSESEINFLNENKTLQAKILQSEHVTGPTLEIDKTDPRPLYVNRPSSNFVWTTTEEIDTVEWSKKCSDVLTHVASSTEGKDDVELLSSKVIQMLYGKKDDLSDLLREGLKSGDFTGLQAECLTDTWIGANRWMFIDLSAGPFSWGPAVGGEGVRTELSLPNVGKTIGAVAEIKEDEAEDKLQDVIRERFSSFGDLEERMHDLKSELEGFKSDDSDESHKKKALDALKRMEKWNLFGDTPEEYQSYTVAHDTFLSHLGATLWGSMRHVVAPSMADGAYHYYEKISFQIYFITQEKVRNMKKLPVNLKALTDGLSSLSVAFQKVMFSQHLLALSEDPDLTMAFSVARRAAAVPLLLVNGTYRLTTRAYLDSFILQRQLQKLSDHGSLKGTHSDSRSTLEVPIFWFIHNDPVLVDKHYQARALSDMVIVVQSDKAVWESHLQCNGKSIAWDLRRPIKAAIAATAEHLSGLLPLHLAYSQVHEAALEDWTWSVGCSPLSITSQGWHLSLFQTDAIARSYIITALEESIQTVNAVIHRLERTMVDKYNSVVTLWRRIATISSGLRYGDAMKLLHLLENSSKGFADHVNNTIALLHPVHCTRQRKVDIVLDLTTIPAFLVVFAILWVKFVFYFSFLQNLLLQTKLSYLFIFLIVAIISSNYEIRKTASLV
ncbi:hypothetical protein IEQ34_012535 [Dendrobium chrysotoxum]|uniref:DUF7906 domain-containing protein n=1 Tax=Dendrobium chrysotoxum TaxID=161865 RepID=A0AAV7GSP0_DENCH|nr:hypothetical protein IEQ34_012535 [Dendrobium chrysotoxum]